MQNVSFRNVSEFLEFLPEDELTMTELLRKLVFDCIPGVSEKLSFNVPFYKRNKTICFIWPASVLWGANKSYEGVRFGFNCGNQMEDEIGYLDKGKRKQIYWKDFKKITDIDLEILRAYLFEAVAIDEQFKKQNGRRSHRN